MEKKSNGLAVAAMVLGILAIIGCNFFYLVPILAVILGIVALCIGQAKGMSITGIVLGGIALVVWPIVDTILAFFTAGLSYII